MNGTETETARVKADLMAEYRRDPVFFVEHALGHLTWSKQREILRSVAANEKTAVRASHSVSKTFTAAEAAVWFLNCFEGSKVITSAPTNLQIEMLLWAEINAIYARSRLVLEGECMTKKIKTDEGDHYAIGFSTDEPARAEGWHAPAILFIFDEAKGLPEWLWDSIRGLMSGGFCRWLVTSTTDGVQVGEQYWKIFREDGKGWNRIHIRAAESPFVTGESFRGIDIPDMTRPDIFRRRHVSPDKLAIQIATQKYIDECAKEWGKDSVLFLTKVEGDIVDEGSDTIIKLSQALEMFENANNPKFSDEGQREAGIDVARGGEDDTSMWARKGMRITGRKVITSKALPEKEKLVYIADEAEVFVGRDKKMRIKIDDTGVGGGLVDILQSRKYNIVPVNFGSAAKDPDKYPNVISEMWHEVAGIVQEISCPKDDRLLAELTNRKRKTLDKKGRRAVESKDDYKARGFRSPDVADGFLLAFYQPAEDPRPRIWSLAK